MQFGNYLDEFLSRRSYVKLLRVLVLNSPAKEWSGREIARAARVDHTVANDSLHIFNDCGMVSMRRFGNANVYRINAHHLVVRQFRRLFEAEQLAKEKLKIKLAKACASNKNILLATIYNGVNGRVNASSDINLLVIVNEKTDLTELFRGVKTEFGTVSLHVWTLEQLQAKRKLPLVRNIVKDGEHVYGGKLEDILWVLWGHRTKRMRPSEHPALLSGLVG